MHEYIERYLNRVEGLKAEATARRKRSDLRQFDSWLDDRGYELTEVGALEIEEYFIKMSQEGYAPNTIASHYESIRTLYNDLYGKFEVVEENPFDDLNRTDYVDNNTKKHDTESIVYVTAEEKEAMCEHVPSPHFRNELIIRLLWQTGMRKGELVELELDDIDPEERSIDVWSPKTKESRTVYYQPSLDIMMEQWLDGGYRDSYTPAEDSPYLFVTERTEQLHISTVNEKIVKPAAENAGIQEVMYTDQAGCDRHRVTSHALRHGHAVHALKNGIDIRTVQKHLGHSKLEMTMKYLQLIDDDVREGYRGFDPRSASSD